MAMQLLPLTVTVDFRVIPGPYSDHARAEHDFPSRLLAQRGVASARLPNRWQQVSGHAHQLGIRERRSPESGDTPAHIRSADHGQLWHMRKALPGDGDSSGVHAERARRSTRPGLWPPVHPDRPAPAGSATIDELPRE